MLKTFTSIVLLEGRLSVADREALFGHSLIAQWSDPTTYKLVAPDRKMEALFDLANVMIRATSPVWCCCPRSLDLCWRT